MIASNTKTDAALAQTQRRYAGDPVRAELLACTRRFKASWLELAEALAGCQSAQHYTRWGFASFEDYCRKELRLKNATVSKLLGSFLFLKRSSPNYLLRDGVSQPLPSLEAVGFLRKVQAAADEGRVTADLLESVRTQVLDDGARLGRVQKQFGEVLFPREEAEARSRREALKLANRLLETLRLLQDLPEGLRSTLEKAIGELAAEVGSHSQVQH